MLTFTLRLWLILAAVLGLAVQARAQCASPANAIVAENCLTGSPQSEWDTEELSGDSSILGFATDISVNRGSTISFKINTTASAYTIDIYRMGYYGGMGARKVTSITPSARLPQTQPACMTDSSVGLMDCGNWAVSASWAVPATATSGIYFAHLKRSDTGGDSHIVFIVRNDSSHSSILFQTSDETWQAYNNYGAGSFYGPASSPSNPTWDLYNRSFKVSYNRPVVTRALGTEAATFVFGPEFAMVQWLEQNGYDVTYFTGVDAARYGSLMLNHKIYMDTGHDEYWSLQHRTNVEAARDAGVNLAFFGGNQIFWKTRWENSIDGSNSQYRTLVCYKETLAFSKTDPTPAWTGTWRDPLLSPPADGGRPENSLQGTLFMVNGVGPDNDGSLQIQVPAADGKMRFWRNTRVASQAAGATYSLPTGTLGYEWDSDIDNGSRPAGLFRLSTTTHTLTNNLLLDEGATYGAGTATHSLTMYRAPSGALVFGAGSIQWAWALNSNHDNPFDYLPPDPDPAVQQAMVNLFADMGVQPGTLQSGLAPATASTDTTPPASTISYPTAGMSLNTGNTITVTGTTTDSGGAVAGVEVSGDGGATWHPATGRASWSYTWTPSQIGNITLLSRAVDDSGNLETPHGMTLTVSPQVCPCKIWNQSPTPNTPDSGDTNPIEVGLKFRTDADGSILGVRFYKASANTGTHVGHLWTGSGTLLASVTFTNESASGWQTANFSSPIAVTANTTYVISYHAPAGHYSADMDALISSGVDNPPLHALADGVDGANGVYAYGNSFTFPTSTFRSNNYWVDVVFTSSNTYKISGNLQGPGGAGATVNLSGSVALSTTADSSGNYSFDGVVNGTYTVAPANSGVVFTPASRSVTVNAGSVPNINFTAVVTNPQTISGTISGSTGGNVTVNLTGTATASTAADSSGNFSFTGLLNGSYTVAPSSSAAIFTPVSKSVVLSGSGASGINFSAQVCNCLSIWPGTATPSLVDSNDTTPIEVGVNFTSSVSGAVSGIRFYKSSANTGTHVGHLWTSTGTLLATATFTGETSSGWQQVTFSSPVPISPNVTYVASYFAPSGHYSADNSYFATNGMSTPPLLAPASTATAGNGVYQYTATGSFPGQTYQATNYWVDVLFAANQSHIVSGTLSGPGAAGATVTYSGGGGTGTVTADASGNYAFPSLMSGTYTISPSNTAAAFIPATQTVVVSSADVTGVNFTGSSLCPCESIWQPTAVPGTVDGGDGTSVETGVRFTADYDGYILGIRFYKAAANTGTHIGNLWTDDGTASLLATNTFQSESDSGWQQVTFAAPVPVSANTSYVASYFAPQGHYSVTGAQFASAGVDAPPLHATANTSKPNGVYFYTTTSAYPANSYNATNYWVDVVYAKATNFSLSGKLTGVGGAGSTVTISGPGGTRNVVADSSGNYRFDGLASGTYTVTPVPSGAVSFSPANQSVTIASNHVFTINFSAVQPTYTISGTLTGGAGDTVSLSGAAAATTTADASGNYSFAGLYNGSYVVTPGIGGFIVTPASQNVTVAGADVAAVNFSATSVQYSISGVIAGGAGATVTLTGASTVTTTADASGNFSFGGLGSGTYLVTPAKAGLVFTPASKSATVFNTSVTGVNFTVPSNCPCDTIWQPSVAPGNSDSGDPRATELGVTFRADADGYIAGIRFYKGATNAGTHIGNLWSSTGTLLGTATFVSESATGWQQVLFSSPIPVTANTSYVASYFAPQGHYSGDQYFFAANGIDAAPLHALQDGVSGSNGVYSYSDSGSSAFPTSTYRSANYWVDVVYLPTSTYSVTGAVSGPGASGATVNITGASTASTVTDASGNFSLTGLANGTYSLSVASSTSYSYSPATQSVTIQNGHVFGLSFSSQALYSITGTISGVGAAGATVSLTGASTATVAADASGAYSFPGLANGSYTVAAAKAGYVYTPASQSVTVNGVNATANFSSVAQTFTITGTISGAGGSGATVSLTGTSTATTTANSSGVYSFTVTNGSYTVTPTKSGYAFTPASQAVTVNGANTTANFSSATMYTISGTISGAGGSGATVNLTGASTATVTANSSGVYSFTVVNGTYTVTPVKAGYAFTPASQSVTVSGGNRTANFSSATMYTISGTISGAGGSGATVNLTGASTATVTANSSGVYSFTVVNGTYTVTPVKTGYVFSPTSQSVTVSNGNRTANFSSSATYTITGTISGAGGSGATVSLTGTSTATVTANSSGVYSFTVVNGTYTVTPTKTGYTFTPASQSVTVSGASKTANFSSAVRTYSISGTISGAGGSGATVKLTGAATVTVTANSSGAYSFTGLAAGNYTVTPTKSGRQMIPASRATTISTSDVTGLNFTSF